MEKNENNWELFHAVPYYAYRILSAYLLLLKFIHVRRTAVCVFFFVDTVLWMHRKI